jgi:murein DD-endopeptidase MepM/ murein hydrolase activator NlpD
MQGPQSTDALTGMLGPLRSRLHLTLQQALLRVAGPFPLAGPAHWLNDWHAYRPCPYPHVHEGLDMVAPRDTPIVAVADATVEAVVIDPRMAGLAVLIRDAGGVEYDYCHLDHFASGLRTGIHVQRGQVIGFVGNTGDAAGGATHLHFEIHLQGVPVPPKPYVDRWLLQAERKARLLGRSLRRGDGAHDDGQPHSLAVAEGAISPPALRPFDPGLLEHQTPTASAPPAEWWSGTGAALPLLLCLPLCLSLWARRSAGPSDASSKERTVR